MTTKQKTVTLMIVGAAVWIGWDIVVAVNDTKGDTISEIILAAAKHPMVPFCFGVLCGHFFWPQDKRTLDGKD